MECSAGMQSRNHWPVVVVGSGPTGLVLANLLARYGIDVLVIEKNPNTVQEPRAVSIDDESLRTMQSVGIINELVPNLLLGYGSDYFFPSGQRFLHVKPSTLEYGYPRRNAFRQPVLEGILRDKLQSCSNASLWFDTELVGLSHVERPISVRLRRNGVECSLQCDFLVGCDGGRSFVRESLGIALEGSTFKERWLIVDLNETTDSARDTKVYCNPARPCLSLPGPNRTRRFEFMLQEGEPEDDVLKPEFVASLLRMYGNDDRASLRRKTVYTFHARMAERWRSSRVFIAGDAAHLMPPFAGQGMNSGVRDAHNLAWKLAMVASGSLGEWVLDTYEVERRRHATEMTQLAIRMGHVMMPPNRLQALLVQTFFRMLALNTAAKTYFAEMKYKPKPRFHDGFLMRSTHSGTLVGQLFPQALVMTDMGFQLLDDVLGDGFTLVAPPGTPPDLLARAALESTGGVHVNRVAILAQDDCTTLGPRIIVARDLRGDLARLLKSYAPGLHLLRPDRYVAAYFAVDEMRSIQESLATLFRTHVHSREGGEKGQSDGEAHFQSPVAG